MFLYDNWYVAALSSEVDSSKPLARMICGEPIVFFRNQEGVVAALEDRCIHRGMPLSQGSLCDGGRAIMCPYHGLEFDGRGDCVKVPSQVAVPRAARVKSYPIQERDGFVWIWPGDVELANPADVPVLDYADDPDWGYFGQAHYEFKADTRMILDNLMDLSHIAYVHVKAINGDPDAENSAHLDVEADEAGRCVHVRRHMPDCNPPPLYRAVVDFKGRIDRWQEFKGSASGVYNWSGGVDTAADTFARTDGRQGGLQIRHFTGLTPSVEGSSHYFFRGIRNFKLGDEDISAKLEGGMRMTLLEDQAILEAQQERINQTPDRPLVSLGIDAGGLQMRRLLKRLMNEQEARRPESRRVGNLVDLDDKFYIR